MKISRGVVVDNVVSYVTVYAKFDDDRFLARDSMLSALYAIAIPSVCPSVCLTSVCPSHGWISQKRLNVSSKFFHHLIGQTF